MNHLDMCLTERAEAPLTGVVELQSVSAELGRGGITYAKLPYLSSPPAASDKITSRLRHRA